MPGRNDPCPCGSGKKYKKCCAQKAAITVEDVYIEELDRVLQTFYDVYPLRKDYQSYIQMADEWKKSLSPYLIEEMTEAIVMDYFFFHERTDIWTSYLEKTKKEMVRPKTIEVLETWNHPYMILARVVGVEDHYIVVEDILTRKQVKVRREGEKPVPLDVHVFCFILPDGSGMEESYLAISSMIFFPKDQQQVFDTWIGNFKKQEQSAEEFYKVHSIELWESLGENGFDGLEFTDFEADVFLKIEAFLEERNRPWEELVDIVEDYVVEIQPKARKAVAIAAGAIRFGGEAGLFEPVGMTIKEIAEEFGVSASSLNKYYNELKSYSETRVAQ
ncbi:YecA family protein [Rummeliibacillus sp. TYF-LIM-RU47]|uniref:YecA family protein n=1 Tax=Rummeliibacillus sp. TYF-LIM-RU47 TaxID=2608406 RepID=UPI00123C6C5B|nr:SEC-C metal-binding domain-containing protein [Rummeliibacillus sp. TYF-LIM-RU47]